MNTSQPVVPAELKLLDQEYQHGDLLLDLYGEFDADGYNVCAVTLAGTNTDLSDLLPYSFLKRLTSHCDMCLPTWEESKRAEAIATARATREQVSA